MRRALVPKLILVTSLAAGSLTAASLAACSKSGGGDNPRGRGGGKLEYPVDVAALDVRQVRYAVTAPGSIEAFQQVQITARVSGAVDKVSFVEGQTVKAGEVLLAIESERYQIAVAQAKATLARSQRPGAFCVVTVPIGEARRGIVVPSLAVAPTEEGNVVYVVDDKNIAHARVVQLGMRTPEGGVELTRGVKAGEVMVVRGIEPLSEGAPVKVKSKTTLEEATTRANNDAAAAGEGKKPGGGAVPGPDEAGSAEPAAGSAAPGASAPKGAP